MYTNVYVDGAACLLDTDSELKNYRLFAALVGLVSTSESVCTLKQNTVAGRLGLKPHATHHHPTLAPSVDVCIPCSHRHNQQPSSQWFM